MALAGFGKVLVIGVGLIGGSLACAIKKHDPSIEVYGVDVDQAALDHAKKLGCIDEGFLEAVFSEDEIDTVPSMHETSENLGDALGNGSIDLVVLATPVDRTAQWFEKLAVSGYTGVITDVGSTKAPVIEAAHEYLPQKNYFVPGHPMAGSEISGIQGARDDLFDGAYWILAPSEDTDMHVFRRLHALFTALGARVIVVAPQEHDKVVAVVSHVPHIVASSLVALAGEHAGQNGELLRLAAGGFKDTTRIASGSPELWTGISLDNAEALAGSLHEFAKVIEEFEKLVRTRDSEGIRELLEKAAAIRDSIPAKWVPKSTELTEVRIPMGDTSGVIASITAAAGRMGCNIQAIEIDHQTEDRAVLELVLTDEGDLDEFISLLKDEGFAAIVKNLDRINE